MKVNGTGAGVPSVDAEAFKASETSHAAGSEKLESAAKNNITDEGGVQDSSLAAGSPSTRGAEMKRLVADIAADLKAGRIGTDAAVDKLVNRIVDRQVDSSASPALRAQVQAALRNTLQNDPFVGAQLSALGRRHI